MPTNQSVDFLLNGKPFMLTRDTRTHGRAWQRQRVQDTLTTQRRMYRSIQQNEVFGGLPDELDHPEVWDDWSGGYGTYRGNAERANHYHVGYNCDTRFPGQAFLAQAPQMLPAAAYASVNVLVDSFLDVPALNGAAAPAGAGAVLLLGFGKIASLTPNSAASFNENYESASAALGFGLSWGHRAAVFGSFVFIPRLDNGQGFYRRGFDGLTYTQSNQIANWFAVAGGRLWRGFGAGNTFGGTFLQSCPIGSDPMATANWSATIGVGNGLLTAQDAAPFEDNLYVGLPDGLYQGNVTGTFNNIATDVGENVGPDNVRDITVQNGGLVFAEGSHVWWFKPSSGANSTLRQIWPTVDVRPTATLMAPTGKGALSFRGTVTCLHGFGRWLYAGVFNGSQSMVFCGVDASGAGPYVWHPMQLFNETVKISRIHVDAITANSAGLPIPRRLWVATDATFGAQANCTAPVYFWPIPRSDETPFGDPTFSANYCSQGYIEQSMTDSETPGVWKAWRKLETWLDGVGNSAASTYVAIGAVVDNTMSSSLDASAFVQRPKDWHYFKNNNNDAIGQSALIGLQLNSPAADSTPLIRSVVGHNVFRPRIAEVIAAKVRIADGIRDRQGGELRPGAGMLDELDTMSRSSNPFPLTDLVGRTYPVIVMPGIDEEESYQDDNSYPEIVATVKMGVLDASWNAAPTQPLHPDGG